MLSLNFERIKELSAKRGQSGLTFDEAIELLKAMPHLVAEVERLRAENAMLKAAVEYLREY